MKTETSSYLRDLPNLDEHNWVEVYHFRVTMGWKKWVSLFD